MIGSITHAWKRLTRPSEEPSREFAFFYENVLGTSLELRVVATDASVAEQAEQAVLAEIDRLERVFSRFRPDSEFRRWQDNPGVPTLLSNELREVLMASDAWRERSGGAFHPATESLVEMWRKASENDRLPDSEDGAHVRERLGAPWRFDDSGAATCLLSPLSLHSIAKGYIVDRSCDAALCPEGDVKSILLNVGGDLCVRGSRSRIVGIVDPSRDAENAPCLSRVRVRDEALATSGDWRRGFVIGGTLYSHIIDGRTGYPASRFHSVSVVARTAMEADILSTIFTILSPPECAAMAESLPDIGYLLITRDGKAHRNARWIERERNE